MHSTPPTPTPLRFFDTLLRFFSSIRLGIALIAVIIIFSAIGSAIPPARQFFELTEFQYFNHWIFGALIGLFCLTLIVATVRRIPFTIRNLGVLTVHAGLLVLCAGSFVYFGQKIEGDVILLAPRINVLSIARAQARQEPVVANFAVFEGKRWSTNMPMVGGRFDIHVVSVTHKGMETGSEAELDVQIGDEPVKRVRLALPDEASRQLDPKTAEAHPQFAKINEAIALQLVPANVENKFLDQQTAMLVVKGGEQSYTFDLPQLPYYQEVIAPGVEGIDDENRVTVMSARSNPIPLLESWRMPISVIPSESTAAQDLGVDVTIDAYLPYVEMQRLPAPGGTHEMPAADLSFKAGGDETDQWLFGSIPSHSMIESRAGARLEFRWMNEKTALDPDWTRKLNGQHVLDVVVKDKNISRQYEVSEGQTIPIEGTDYVLTVEKLMPSWPLMTASHKDARTPTALIWVKSPAREFQRSVLQRYPDLNQDRDRAGKKILETGGLVDENLVLKYADCATPHFLVAAGHNLTPTAVYTTPGGARTVRALAMGKSERFDDGSELTIREIIEKPQLVDHPVVVPENRRRPFGDVRRSQSAIHVKLTPRNQPTAAASAWIPFSYYNAKLVDVPQMVPADTEPTVVSVAGRDVSLTYGRAERDLPAPVTLERLKTDFHPGGRQQSGWESFFRYFDPITKQPMHTSCWLNNTAKIGDWHLFQATHSPDDESYTGLGVGNRRGVAPMLMGCVLIALGMIYAFTVKPMIIKRMKRKALEAAGKMGGELEMGPRQPASTALAGVAKTALIALGLLFASAANVTAVDVDPAAKLREIQSQIDTQTLGAIVVQYNARFSSLEAWARDNTQRIAGAGNKLLGLQPTIAAIEMTFNRGAYLDAPIIYVKDLGIRKHLTSAKSGMDDETRARIKRQGLISRSFLDKPEIQEIVVELASDTRLRRPMGQLASAKAAFDQFGEDWLTVPADSMDPTVPWHHIEELIGNLPATTRLPKSANAKAIPGVSAEQAQATLTIYRDFAKAWLDRDVAGINSNLDKLQKSLASFAPGTYPTSTQRVWEVKYYRMNLVWWAWVFYILTFFAGVFATGTGYRWARRITLSLLTVALLIHAGEIGVRWYVIGRIPVANMYEAVVSSTFVGALIGYVLELILPRRVFSLASGFLGMFTLALPELNVLGVSNSISTMAPILDDVMLRIHTVLIISSYAVIALAFAVSNCYLFLSVRRERAVPAVVTVLIELLAIVGTAGYYAWVTPSFYSVLGVAFSSLIAAVALAGMRLFPNLSPPPLLSLAAASGAAPPLVDRSAVGGTPGSIGAGTLTVKSGLNLFREFDRCQCILIYIATIALFVGIVLGAVWADYSWGRPWGWDPKEVFALNTWLVYAILIHARFVSKDRALWTAVLSVAGFAAMQFNWWVVNFYIVGLHSYA